MQVYACSDTGRVRSSNEDAYHVAELNPPAEAAFLAVADGMGGAAGGEIASQVAIQTIAGRVRARYESWEDEPVCLEGLRQALHEAHAELLAHQERNPELAGMGTTFTGALVRGSRIYTAHTGDSRAYLCHGDAIRRLTDDHSVVGELVRMGSLTEAEAQHHPQRNLLTSALGTHGPLEVDVRATDWAPGDILVLCSDGLTGLVADAEILAALADRAHDPARQLVDLANARGGHDNITVLAALHPGTAAAPGRGQEEVNP